MKILNLLLFVAAIGCLIAAFMGHSAGWSAAAVLFFASTMLFLSQKRKNGEK